MSAKASPFQIKAVSRTGYVEGIASAFGVVDADMDVVVKGAYSAFLKRVKPGSPDFPRMLWSHSRTEPIGVWDELRETSTGLLAKGRLLLDVQRGREVHAMMRAKAATGLSVGFALKRWDFDERKRVRRLLEIDLKEISPCVFPSCPTARVLVAKADGAEVDADIEQAASDFAAFVLDDLGLRSPLVLKFEKQVDHLGAAGEFDPRSPDTICLRSDLSRRQMLLTCAHECKHVAQSRRGAFGLKRRVVDLDVKEVRSLEAEAESYACDALKRYECGLDKLIDALRSTTKAMRSRRCEPEPTISKPTRSEDRDWRNGRMARLYMAGW